jgi:hypothetical protein
MYYLPMSPYHSNLFAYWRAQRDNHLDEDLWSWAKKEWGATVLIGRWRFNTEKDAAMFAIRWS